ncbi:MAG: polysaccharide biosynthesis C-terminal domain-containing protein [Clostridia bacterium]|nr:polysaccharide biosynthesis C-terminal domain-containing protein [Clostridia bacterium]
MNRYRKLLSNTAIFGAGTFLSKVLSYLLIFIYTSLLTKSQISDAEFVQQISNLIMPLAAVGVCDAITRFTIDAGDRRKEIFSSSVAILLGGSVAFLLLSPVLLLFDALDGYYLLIILFVLCANLQMAVSFYARSRGLTALYAIQGVLNTALTIGLSLLFIYLLDLGVTGLLLSVTVANFIVTVFLVLRLRIWRDLDFRTVKRATVRALLVYGIPMIPTTILWAATNLTDHYIVRTVVDGGVEGYPNDGLFVCSYKIPNVLTLITTVFIEAWNLSAVRDSAEGEEREEFFEKVFRSYSSIIFTAGALLIAFSRHISRILLNREFYGAWEFIPLLIVSTVFSAFATFISTVFSVSKKTLPAFLTALAGAAVNVAVSFLLAPVLGVHGVAIGTLVSYLSLFILRCVIAGRYVKFSVSPLKLALNALIMTAQAVCMIFEFPSGAVSERLPVWFLVQTGFVIAIAAVNFASIREGIALVFGSLAERRARKKN